MVSERVVRRVYVGLSGPAMECKVVSTTRLQQYRELALLPASFLLDERLHTDSPFIANHSFVVQRDVVLVTRFEAEHRLRAFFTFFGSSSEYPWSHPLFRQWCPRCWAISVGR